MLHHKSLPELIRMAFGDRVKPKGVTVEDWMVITQAVYALRTEFAGDDFYTECAHELGITSRSIARKLAGIGRKRDLFSPLIALENAGEINQHIGYPWLCTFTTLTQDEQEDVLVKLAKGEPVSDEYMQRIHRVNNPQSNKIRRNRIKRNLTYNGNQKTDSNFVDALRVVAQGVADVVSEADSKISGDLNPETAMSREDVQTWLQAELGKLKTSIPVKSGGRSKVLVGKDRVTVRFTALRNDHPLTAEFTLTWGE